MRACQQCGLSIGDRATFCPVCGTLVGSAGAPSTAEPRPAQPVFCALCGHPGPLVDAESFRLCLRCHGEVELLVDREPRAGLSISRITTEEDARRSAAQTVRGGYETFPGACDECAAMAGRTTTDLAEAEGWTPNTQCTDPQGCRCLVIYDIATLDVGEVRAFLAYAAGHGLAATAQAVDGFHAEVRSRQEGAAGRQNAAALRAEEARRCEKTDATRAAALYRQAIGQFLELSEDPLDSPYVRSQVLSVFDRLSLVLMRSGLQNEALEEIDSAAWLGLLDCQDIGVKGHREALNKRRIRLRRAVAKAHA